MIELDDFRPKSRALYGLDENSDLSSYLSDRACTNAMRINMDEAWRLNDKKLMRTIFGRMTDKIVVTHGYVAAGWYHQMDTTSTLSELLDAGTKLVVKPSHGTSGKSVEVVESIPGRSLAALGYIQSLENYVVTEWIEQASYAAKMWPNAANTVRVLTMRPFIGGAFIADAVQRIGTAASGTADNWALGGLSAPISVDGTLGAAASQMGEFPPLWHETHPDTGGRIKGVTIPHWDQTVALALDLAERLYELPYVGWDFVVTPDGPILLEANADPGVHIHQVHHGLFDNPLCRDFYRSHLVDGIE